MRLRNKYFLTYTDNRLNLRHALERNKQKALAGRKRREDELDKLAIKLIRSLQINTAGLYGGKNKLTDSSVYKVEIAQFQDLILQKQKF